MLTARPLSVSVRQQEPQRIAVDEGPCHGGSPNNEDPWLAGSSSIRPCGSSCPSDSGGEARCGVRAFARRVGMGAARKDVARPGEVPSKVSARPVYARSWLQRSSAVSA
jgi:hypothetical protein